MMQPHKMRLSHILELPPKVRLAKKSRFAHKMREPNMMTLPFKKRLVQMIDLNKMTRLPYRGCLTL